MKQAYFPAQIEVSKNSVSVDKAHESALKLSLLGSGDTGGVPLYGCFCAACKKARTTPSLQRRASSALLESAQTRLLIDASCDNFEQRFPSGSLQTILLTHYHMDHVEALFRVRWGVGERINVLSPADEEGCSDLYKHNGLLDFYWLHAFQPFCIGDICITPLPLIHSKKTFGYCLQTVSTLENAAQPPSNNLSKIAYLCDTVGLSAESKEFLHSWQPHCLVIDCTFPPTYQKENRNHNNLHDVLAIIDSLNCKRVVLTHIGHQMDHWLLEHASFLPSCLSIGYDGLVLKGS